MLAKYGAIFLVIVSSCNCQYEGGGGGGGGGGYDRYNYNTPPPPQIITHKQALNHDGNFKYVFTAENGLAQGETISPDGSRNGGYTYVDPTGKKISVKYTAGKEGFRILEGDHLPKAPAPIVPVPGAGLPVPQGGPHDDGQYRPQLYANRPPQYYNAGPPQTFTPAATYNAQPQISPRGNALDDSRDYNEPPGKPHSFGNGYIFEFGG